MTYLGTDSHTPKFVGEVWYVDNGMADDTGNGKTPGTAKKTIGAAIAACAIADAITIKAGTYTETGLDLNKASVELWCEIGTIIDPASGTALTISANYCRIQGPLYINPAAAAIGLLLSGSYIKCNTDSGIEGVTILNGATGISVTGAGCSVANAACGYQTTAGYSITGAQTRFSLCSTVGNTTTTGYSITGSADTGVLRACTSAGHETAGFSIGSGSSDWTMINCSSGAGDGRWVDTDGNNVWSNFAYDKITFKAIPLTAAGGVGGAGTNYNVFKLTGSVKLFNIFGEIKTATPATNATVNLELYSTNAAIDITASAGAPNIISRCVGTVLVKESVSTDPLEIGEPDGTPAVVENANYRDPKNPIIIQKDDSADTYVQMVLSANPASGLIHWHCEWEPITDDGWLEAV